MTVKELIKKLQELDKDDPTIFIRVAGEEVKAMTVRQIGHWIVILE